MTVFHRDRARFIHPGNSDWICIFVAVHFVAAIAMGCTSIPVASTEPDESCQHCWEGGSAETEIPFESHRGLVVVSAQIKGNEAPVRLVLDTGSPTVLRSAAAANASVRPDSSWQALGAKDAEERLLAYQPILIDRLSLGSMQFADIPAVAIHSPIFDRFCPPLDGLLGTRGLAGNLGVLDRATIEIDRDRGRLSLFRNGAPQSTADTILPLRNYYTSELGEKIFDSTTIPVMLSDNLIWAELDTGGAGLSEMTLDVFVKSGGTLEDEAVHEFVGPHVVSAGGMSSSTRSWIVRLEDVRLGAIAFKSVPFRIVEHGHEPGGSVVLAQNVIRQFNLTLDYPRDQLLLTKRRSFESEPAVPTQIVWDVREGRVITVGLLKDGVAETAGIKIGDELLAFDGDEIRVDDPNTLCAMRGGFEASSKPVRLRLRRGDHEFEVTLPSEESI